jgi:single-strand DNA-binding protein
MTPTTPTTTTVGAVGNLTDDPELRFGKSGTAWMRARISVQPYVKGQVEKPEPVFLDLVCFGSLAENVCDVASKGDRLVVSGRLEDDTWTGRDGMERTSQKIVCDAVGLDLRFAAAEINWTQRSEPAAPRPDTTIAGLLGPVLDTTNTDMPF